MKRKIWVKNIILLQAVIVIYTFNSVVAKLASGKEMFSLPFFTFYALEIMILGIYALLWQQMIKRFDLSVAYANRAMALLWSTLWAVLLFHETFGIRQIIGILLVVAGTMVVNSEGKETAKND
ncbi:MAG: EamA family transporter [Lachnospiraceae bacterium]|nr:EamA family transporter [Lachnospiraceae bacterium]